MLRLVSIALVVVAACASTPKAAPGAPPAQVGVRAALLEDPEYRKVEDDAAMADQFRRYWTWLGTLGIPDVEYLAGLPEDDLERLAMLFHEKVELRGWLELGHRFDDVMSQSYYQEHYPEVYPVAHPAAMRAELALLEGFAARHGFARVPERAFVLVAPMVERRGVPPAMVDRRLKFNPDVAAQTPTRDELETAARVYEAGGYTYRDRAAVIEAARSVDDGRGASWDKKLQGLVGTR